jgi:MG2 domain
MIIIKLLFALSSFYIWPGIATTSTPYDSARIIEKVYLHTDREVYFPGDDIWFKAYLVDATERLLTCNSTNLHVELISPAPDIINSRIVKLTGGLGNGDFHLPDNLKSGKYRLRAYTNYMRNFGEELFFCKDIMIIQPSDDVKDSPDSVPASVTKPEISFFPEGGSLVDNVTSMVAFKAVDSHGAGCDVSGKIYSSGGEQVTAFKSTHKGMGTFYLDPVPGVKYYAVTSNRQGDLFRFDIQGSFPTGVVMNVSKNSPEELFLIFKSNRQTLTLLKDHDLLLTVSARGITLKTYSFRMVSFNSFFNLPTSDLPEGIVMLTLSGSDNIPLCERLVFIRMHDVKVKVETDRSIYNKRDSVSVRVSFVNDSSHLHQDAFLSLSSAGSIFMDNPSGNHSTIASWFLLESDIRGPVEDPSYYFDPSNPSRLNDLDLLLLTQGWRDFRWKYGKAEYLPENGFTISGRVRKKFADAPLKNPSVNIGLFGTGKPLFRIVPADSTGRFCLTGLDLTGDKRMIASVTGENDKLKGQILLDSIGFIPPKLKGIATAVMSPRSKDKFMPDGQFSGDNQLQEKNIHKYIQYVEYKESIRKKYKLSDTIPMGEIKVVARRVDAPESASDRNRRYLMGFPDKELVVTPDLRGYTDAYQLINTRFVSPIKLPWGISVRMQYPLYMIDGMEVSEDEVRALPVNAIERVDVLEPLNFYAVFGARVVRRDSVYRQADGAISIILRDDFFGYNATPVYHSVNIKFSGYDEPRVFYSPRHHTTLEKDYKPDLRTTLFWKPDIKVENNRDIFLNYYNSDNASNVRIIVEGITSGGIPVTASTEYEIH